MATMGQFQERRAGDVRVLRSWLTVVTSVSSGRSLVTPQSRPEAGVFCAGSLEVTLEVTQEQDGVRMGRSKKSCDGVGY